MAYLSSQQLKEMKFRSLGVNIKISDKASIYNPESITIGDHSRIDDFCVISGFVNVGKNVHITIFCNVAGGEKGVTLEDFSTLAYGCQVFSQSDDYSGESMTNSTVPVRYKNEKKVAVLVKRHSIVGAGTIILPGVILGEGTSVGAMSLVTKSTEPWSIYFGVPAKKIKNRSRNLLLLEKHFLEEEKECKVEIK